MAQRIEITAESLGISKGLEGREEVEFAGVEGLLQIGQEQSAEQAGQHPYGQEETGAARNPTVTVGRDPATRNDTMQVGMKEQILSPTVQHGEEADLGAQMFGIGSDGGQGLGRGSEQNAVDEIFVLVSNGGDLFGEREDDMKIRESGEFPLSVFRPIRHAPRTGTWGNVGRGSYRSRAARKDSCRSARDDRPGPPCGTPRSRS